MMVRGAVRRGETLLAGLLRCAHCGRKLHVAYSGTNRDVGRYHCRGALLGEVAGAGLLAGTGVFALVGGTVSGWLSDRWDNRLLLFSYYGFRGLSLLYLPFATAATGATAPFLHPTRACARRRDGGEPRQN
jgi:Recombinase zinc beta ribbon domain